MKGLCQSCVVLVALSLPLRVTAEATAGRGGPFIGYHTSSLAAFDPEIKGNPIIIGGTGYGLVSKKFRIGGGGGGGFLINASENTQFGMGFGGAVGEYIVADWLTARLLIGGGGYAVAKIISETDTDRTLRKISTGGFVLFYPSLNGEIPLNSWIKLVLGVGYFLPNIPKLESITVTAQLMFGK